MLYIYGCSDKSHPRVFMAHRMMDNPEVFCSTCGKPLHRVPQAFQFYNNPTDTLLNNLDDGYRKYRARKAKQR